MNIKVIDIAIIAIFAGILFSLEQVLSFLPNIQLTVFLLVLYSKKLGFIRTSIITIIHVILDNIFIGSFNLIYVPFMLVGWIIIPVTLNTIFKKINQPFFLSLLGILFSFIYSWMFVIPNCVIQDVAFWGYLSADILFEIILAASSFLSILWLYDPCNRALEKIIPNYIK